MLPEKGTKEFEAYLNDISQVSRPKRHKFYKESVKHMHAMGIHMTGDNPKDLLDIKRPNEDEEAKKYRLKSYKAKTKASANKVTSVINRIYNERLFSIEYPESPLTTIDEQKDGLKNYLTKEMPFYISLMNYIKSVFSKMHLKDPNGVVGVLPSDFGVIDTELFKPIPIFYTAKEVVDFKDGEYYTIQLGGMEPHESIRIIIFDREMIRVFFKEKQGDDFQSELEYTHGFGETPAFRVGGVVVDTEPPQLFESFIAGVLPHWDDAVTMYSDLQAAIVNHLYPDKWEYTVDCDADGCDGGRKDVCNADGENTTIDCPSCHGTGKRTSKSPFHVYQVNADALNPDAPLPTPPFGYGEKELGSTELLVQLAEAEIEKGYSAVNMDILNKVGENQSGVSKVIDRQDLDGFLDVYSSHVFNYILPNMIWYIMLWRYSVIFGDKEKLKEYFPKIKEPTTFDVYSISLLTEEFARLKESGVSGALLGGMEKDIIEKRFTNQGDVDFYKSIIDIDPLAHLTNDEMLTNSRVIGPLEMYIHTYAKDLVEEAIDTKDDFLSLPLMERKEIIRALAESKQPKVIEVEPIIEDGED